RYGLKIEVDVKGQRRLSLPIEKALYRVAQEALNNIVKHAQATVVNVTLNTQDNGAYLTVQDNGVGIVSKTTKTNTLGLTSMRERVEQLDGFFEIGPNPAGNGTLVKVGVPCDQ